MSKTQRDLKALRQQQRAEAAARQRARDRRNLIIIGAVFAVAAIGIWGYASFLNHQAQVSTVNRLTFQAASGTAGIQIPDEGPATHIDPSTQPVYKFYPPTSGPHYGAPYGPVAWQTIGSLSEGQFVHNLEHGGVAVLYDCPSGSACTTLVNQLKNYVQNLAPIEPTFGEVKMVMTPYTRGMQNKVALVAWHWVEFLDGYNQAEITRFYEIHADKGPEQIA